MYRSINCFGHSSVNIVEWAAANIQVHVGISLAAFLFPISMFWIAWTCRPPINIYISLCGLAGFAISGHISMSLYVVIVNQATECVFEIAVFLAVSDYTVESYGLMASSAVTAQSFARGTSNMSSDHRLRLVFLSLEPLCGILSLVIVQFYQNGTYSL